MCRVCVRMAVLMRGCGCLRAWVCVCLGPARRPGSRSPRRAVWLSVCAGCCDTAAAAGGAAAADGAAAVRPYGSVAQPQLRVPGRGTVVWVLSDPPMPGFLLLAPLLDLERDRVCRRCEARFRLCSGCFARRCHSEDRRLCLCARMCVSQKCMHSTLCEQTSLHDVQEGPLKTLPKAWGGLTPPVVVVVRG